MIALTLFRNEKALTKFSRQVTFAELADRIAATRGSRKEKLWWLKLATFGDLRSERGCLRNDANVVTVTGVECDYDGETVPFDEAVARVRAAGLRAILYTSPSHSPCKPHWRVLFPFAGPRAPGDRAPLADRANAVLGGVLADESWRLSQGYYFGGVSDDYRVTTTDGDYIDERDDIAGLSRPEPAHVASTLVGESNVVADGPLSDYAKAALRDATALILTAPKGRQEQTLNAEAYGIGRAVGSGYIPANLALRVLVRAAEGIPNYDPRRPWRRGEAAEKVRSAFRSGTMKPRPDPAQINAEFDRLMAEVADVG